MYRLMLSVGASYCTGCWTCSGFSFWGGGASGSFWVGPCALCEIVYARINLVKREIIAISSSTSACTIMDSLVVAKDCLWSGKSRPFSKTAVSKNVRIDEGCCC